MKIEYRLPFFYFSISKKIKIWTQIFIFQLSEKMNNRNIFFDTNANAKDGN